MPKVSVVCFRMSTKYLNWRIENHLTKYFVHLHIIEKNTKRTIKKRIKHKYATYKIMHKRTHREICGNCCRNIVRIEIEINFPNSPHSIFEWCRKSKELPWTFDLPFHINFMPIHPRNESIHKCFWEKWYISFINASSQNYYYIVQNSLHSSTITAKLSAKNIILLPIKIILLK